MRSVFLSATVAAIFAAGALVIFSTSSAEVLDLGLERPPHLALMKQLFYAAAGGLLFFAVRRAGYRAVLEWSPLLFWFAVFLLLLVLIPGIGKEVNGSRRWLGVGALTFQPSEFVKYLMPLYLIHRFIGEKEPLSAFRPLARAAAPALLPILLVLVEPNNGTALVLGLSVVVLLFLFSVPFKFWAFPLIGLLVVGGFFAHNLPYVSARLKVYLNPELDLRGRGHQPYQAKIAAGSGQLLGKGPGKSFQKLSYLPEAQNDYIGAIFAEEYGFLGMAFLIFLYMLFTYLGIAVAWHAEGQAGFALAAVVTFLIAFQAFLNLGVVSGLLPSTGLNLPFFSQGGSSLMANLMGFAFLISIAAAEKKELAYS